MRSIGSILSLRGPSISAHFFGLLWLVNLGSPYLNIALNSPGIPAAVYAVLMGGVAIGLLLRKRAFALSFPRLARIGLLYLLWTLLLAIFSGTRQEGWGFLVQGGSVILAMMAFRNPGDYRIVLSWIVFGMASFGLFLVWQSITGYKPPWLNSRYFLHDVGSFIRAGEGFGEKNYSASLLVLGLIICWAMFAYRQTPRQLARLAFVACILGVLFTFSRGALVALGAVFACYGLTSIRRFRHLMLGGLFVIPVAVYLMGDTLDLLLYRFSPDSQQDVVQATTRWDQIQGGIDMLQRGSFFEFVFGYGPFVLVNEMIIHNIPMGLFTEQGIAGLLLWMCVIINIGRFTFALFRHGNPFPLMALVGFFVAGMTVRIEVERTFWLMLLFVHAFPRCCDQVKLVCSTKRTASESAPVTAAISTGASS